MDDCADIDECAALQNPCAAHAICENTAPGYVCKCQQGFRAKPDAKILCEQVDVNILCSSNFDCTNNAECIDGQCFCQDGFEPQGSVCSDIDECRTENNICGDHSTCTNTPGSYHCECENGFVGTPPRILCKAPCEDVKCGPHAYCKPDRTEAYCMCEEGWTYNPSDISAGCIDIDECDAVHGPSGRCGQNAICRNVPGSYSCECPKGFNGNPAIQCFEINECTQEGRCGPGAICKNLPGSYECTCPDGTLPDPDPSVRCVAIVTCANDEGCPGNSICDQSHRCLCPEPNIGNDCRHPCESMSCGPNAHCMIVNRVAQCLCSEGFAGGPLGGCIDINECAGNACPSGAVCTNTPGSYTCQCPGGTSGDPYKGGCAKTGVVISCSESQPCPIGENCISDSYSGTSVCICRQGYMRDAPTGQCVDVDECGDVHGKIACGVNAICKNLPGSYECQCPPNFNGNPYSLCEECNTPECQCQPPYRFVGGNCILAGCSDGGKCPPGAECISISGGVSYCACPKGYRTQLDGSCLDVDECAEGQATCGYGAECVNKLGGYDCTCPAGYGGDPYNGLCSPPHRRCAADGECGNNEKCVQPGECVCPPPYFLDTTDGNKCKSPCERFPCGINAKCTPSDPPQCLCEVGYKGDPLRGCVPANECDNLPCAYGAQCIDEKGGYKCVCPKGQSGDAYKSGCILSPGTDRHICHSNEECASNLACVNGDCVSPCASLLCGANALCESENHAAWCRCRIGFVEGASGECVSRECSHLDFFGFVNIFNFPCISSLCKLHVRS